MAIAASTLTTLCVFFPLIFMEGMMGIIFQELALTVSFSLIASLVVALTLVPMLSAKWLTQEPGEHTWHGPWQRLAAFWDKGLAAIDTSYSRLLAMVLRHRTVVMLTCVGLLGLSFTLYGQLGSELLPSVDESMMYINIDMPVGTRLEITDAVVDDVARVVRETAPDVQAMFTRTGIRPGRGGSTHTGFLWVRLTEPSERQQPLKEVITMLRQKLSNYPGATIRIVERPSDVARLLGAGRTERIEIDVIGFDLQRGRVLAQEVAKGVQAIAGISYVRLNIDDSRPEMQITIDRLKAASLGVSVQTILQAVETSVAGTVASTYREGRDEYDIRVRLQEADRQELADLDRIFVTTSKGQQIPLRTLTLTRAGTGPVVIERRGQERAITVQAGMTGSRDLGSIAADIEHLLATMDTPEGFRVVLGGERQEQQASNQNMLLTTILAIFLVYMIMAALFESLVHPFVILFTIPFAAIGGILMLWLTGTNVSIPVHIGAIMLVGVAVNNGIVLVDYTNQLRQQGLGIMAATQQGAVTRLRPVLITTLTTVLALIPMAIGVGEGSEVWAPLGRVVLGGLTVTTLFTLFFIPALYSVIEERRTRHLLQPEFAPRAADTEAAVAD